jgi:hypothetical protein
LRGGLQPAHDPVEIILQLGVGRARHHAQRAFSQFIADALLPGHVGIATRWPDRHFAGPVSAKVGTCKGPAVKQAGMPARSQRHGNRQHQQRISERIPFHVAKPFSRILLETGPHRPNGRLSRTTAYLNLHCHLTGLSTHLRENT